MRDENQLHAAVVELIALDDAQIKYSTVQNWYPGDDQGRRRHLQLRHQAWRMPRAQLAHLLDAGGNRLGDHLEVPELRAARRRLDRGVLLGRNRQQLSAGRHRHEDDPHRPEHAQHHRLQGHLRRSRPEHLPRTGEDPAERAGRAQFHPVRFAADGRAVRRAHLPVRRGEEPDRHGRARGEHLARSARISCFTACSAVSRTRMRST